MRELLIFPRPDQATPRQVRLIGAVVALWAALCMAVAAWVGLDVHRLDQWSTVLDSTGSTLETTASALDGLRGNAAVGSEAGLAAAELRSVAAQSRTSASYSRSSIHQLSYELALALGLIPSLPAVVAFGRFRLSRARERQALMEALCDASRRGLVVRYLAERAVENLSHHELLPGTAGLSVHERRARLAEAELARLGLDPRAVTDPL